MASRKSADPLIVLSGRGRKKKRNWSEVIARYSKELFSASVLSEHGIDALADLIGREAGPNGIKELWMREAPTFAPLIGALRDMKGWPPWEDSSVAEVGGLLLQNIVRRFPKTFMPKATLDTQQFQEEAPGLAETELENRRKEDELRAKEKKEKEEDKKREEPNIFGIRQAEEERPGSLFFGS